VNAIRQERARDYWVEYSIYSTIQNPNQPYDGFSGGSQESFRYGMEWLTPESIAETSKYAVKHMAWLIESVISTEARRIVSAVCSGLRRKPQKPLQFTITRTLTLGYPSEGGAEVSSFSTAVFIGSEESVQDALDEYGAFVIESMTAALHTEQDLARERATGFWTEWVGA
jgi:hypothetical protein